jgi:hypothetical protein
LAKVINPAHIALDVTEGNNSLFSRFYKAEFSAAKLLLDHETVTKMPRNKACLMINVGQVDFRQ